MREISLKRERERRQNSGDNTIDVELVRGKIWLKMPKFKFPLFSFKKFILKTYFPILLDYSYLYIHSYQHSLLDLFISIQAYFWELITKYDHKHKTYMSTMLVCFFTKGNSYFTAFSLQNHLLLQDLLRLFLHSSKMSAVEVVYQDSFFQKDGLLRRQY